MNARTLPITPTLCLPLNNFSPSPEASFGDLLERAAVADRIGIDRVLVVDHVVMGNNIDAYDGSGFPTGPDGPWLEPMTVLSVIAGRTRRVRLATGILIATLRRPVVLAKAAATLDVLSGGRLDLGVGIGWQREEYEACGVPFEERGARLDDTIAICQRLWRDQPASHHSPYVAFDNIWCAPRPFQPNGVPIWVSGRVHRKTIERAVRFGAGWIPWGEDRADPRPGIAQMRDALVAAGRDPLNFQIRGLLPLELDGRGAIELEPAMELVREHVGAGITDFHLQAQLPTDPSALEDHLTPLVDAFRVVTGRAPRDRPDAPPA